jgi:hypothetical protein
MPTASSRRNTMRTATCIFALVFVFATRAAETQEQVGAASRVPACANPSSGHKLIGWGEDGLKFSVPKRGVKILGGKPDVDYVRFVIKPNDRDVRLVLWFGPYALKQEPERETLETSATFTQTKLLGSDGATIGLDSRGQYHNNTKWRHFAIGAQGAVYESVSPADATLFDQIIESACLGRRPSR